MKSSKLKNSLITNNSLNSKNKTLKNGSEWLVEEEGVC